MRKERRTSADPLVKPFVDAAIKLGYEAMKLLGYEAVWPYDRKYWITFLNTELGAEAKYCRPLSHFWEYCLKAKYAEDNHEQTRRAFRDKK